MINSLTIDVEEYFHPTEVQMSVTPEQWHTFPSRVEGQVNRILDLLESHNTRATFFILGWVAEHHPALVRRIAERGHDVACHSYAHRLIYDLTPSQFREDTCRAINVISNACGIRPVAYRAPSYSITASCLWALEILVECGFRFDSSIYPISHDRYGIPGFSRHPTVLSTPSGPIEEIPIATVRLGTNVVAPIGGGGYLRLLPYRYTAAGIRRVNEEEHMPACIYFHPWEIDPDQPKLAKGSVSRMRTYTGMATMEWKINRLLTEFTFSTLGGVYERQEVAAAVAN